MMLTDRTLEELDGVAWREPDPPWSLAADCHRLRRVPLKEFTGGDLARMIRQKIGLDYLVPVAVSRLLDAPFAGDLYDGELINAVANLSTDFWPGHPDLAGGLDLAVANARRVLQDGQEPQLYVDQQMRGFLQDYQNRHTTTRPGETQT